MRRAALLALRAATAPAAGRAHPAAAFAGRRLSSQPAPADDVEDGPTRLRLGGGGGGGPTLALALARLGGTPGAAVTAAAPDATVIASATLATPSFIDGERPRHRDGRPTADFRDRSAARTTRARGGDGPPPPPDVAARALLTSALVAGAPPTGVHVAASLRGGAAGAGTADALPHAVAAAALAAAAAGAPLTHALGVGRACASDAGVVTLWPDRDARAGAAVDALCVTAAGADAAVDVLAREAPLDAVLAALAAARADAAAGEAAVGGAAARAAAAGPPPPPPRGGYPDPAAAAAYAAALTPHLTAALDRLASAACLEAAAAAVAGARAAAVRDLRARGAWRVGFARAPGSGCVSSPDEEAAAPGLIASALAARAAAGDARAGGRGARDARPVALDAAPLPGAHGAAGAASGGTRVTATVSIVVDKGRAEDAGPGGEGPPLGRGRLRVSVARPPHAPPPHIAFPATGPRAAAWHADGDACAALDRGLGGALPGPRAGGDGGAQAALPWPFGARVAVDVLSCDGAIGGPALAAVSLALAAAGAPLARCVGGGDAALVRGAGASDWHVLADPDALELAAAAGVVSVAATVAGVTAARVEARAGGGLPPATVDGALRAATASARAAAAAADAAAAALTPDATFGAIPVAKEHTGRVLGVGGGTLRGLEALTGALVALGPEDPPPPPGTPPPPPPPADAPSVARYYAPDAAAAAALRGRVAGLTGSDIVAGASYAAVVTDVADFGAFVRLPGGARELVHISELAHHRVASVEEVVGVGDEVQVVCLGRDARGLLRLSRRAALPAPEEGGGEGAGGGRPASPRGDKGAGGGRPPWRGGGSGRPPRGGGDRGGRPRR